MKPSVAIFVIFTAAAIVGCRTPELKNSAETAKIGQLARQAEIRSLEPFAMGGDTDEFLMNGLESELRSLGDAKAASIIGHLPGTQASALRLFIPPDLLPPNYDTTAAQLRSAPKREWPIQVATHQAFAPSGESVPQLDRW